MTGLARADFAVVRAAGPATLTLLGDWVVLALGDAPTRLARAGLEGNAILDIGELGRVDTAGAVALMQVLTRQQADQADAAAAQSTSDPTEWVSATLPRQARDVSPAQ